MTTTPLAVRRKSWSRKRKRLGLIAGLGLVLGAAVGLVLFALQEQIVFFYSPGDVALRDVEPGQFIRIGGLVKDDSWQRDGVNNSFIITDGVDEVATVYVGVLPDLFRNGQGVVAEGKMLEDGTFQSSNVLAKHDENYMPKEVVDALKDSGEWQHGQELSQ